MIDETMIMFNRILDVEEKKGEWTKELGGAEGS